MMAASIFSILRPARRTRRYARATHLRAAEMMSRRKTGRPRIEDRARSIEARKPWLKLNMSRRTWYRHQAEQREKGTRK
jgi:hypothetical protein